MPAVWVNQRAILARPDAALEQPATGQPVTRVERRLAEGPVCICRGGRSFAKSRHDVERPGLTRQQWHEQWEAERLFICADGGADKAVGNETIRHLSTWP